MAGLQGCPGSLYDDDSCNTQVGLHRLKIKYYCSKQFACMENNSFENPWKPCGRGESEKAEFNEFGIKRSFAHTTINSFQDSITSS